MKVKITLEFKLESADQPTFTDEKLKQMSHFLGTRLLEAYKIPSRKKIVVEEIVEREVL